MAYEWLLVEEEQQKQQAIFAFLNRCKKWIVSAGAAIKASRIKGPNIKGSKRILLGMLMIPTTLVTAALKVILLIRRRATFDKLPKPLRIIARVLQAAGLAVLFVCGLLIMSLPLFSLSGTSVPINNLATELAKMASDVEDAREREELREVVLALRKIAIGTEKLQNEWATVVEDWKKRLGVKDEDFESKTPGKEGEGGNLGAALAAFGRQALLTIRLILVGVLAYFTLLLRSFRVWSTIGVRNAVSLTLLLFASVKPAIGARLIKLLPSSVKQSIANFEERLKAQEGGKA